jgi:hypothetical protein
MNVNTFSSGAPSYQQLIIVCEREPACGSTVPGEAVQAVLRRTTSSVRTREHRARPIAIPIPESWVNLERINTHSNNHLKEIRADQHARSFAIRVRLHSLIRPAMKTGAGETITPGINPRNTPAMKLSHSKSRVSVNRVNTTPRPRLQLKIVKRLLHADEY